MKLSVALRAAKARGYDGAPKADDVLTFLRGVTTDLIVNGKKIDLANLKLDDDTALVIDEEDNTKSAPKGEDKAGLPSDFDARLEVAVQDRLKKLGLIDAEGKARPAFATSEVKAGKSAEERMYEDRVKSGSATFRDYDTAYGWHQWLGWKFSSLGQNWDAADAFKKRYGDWAQGKTMTTTGVASAGPLVPDAFRPDLIRVVNEAGDAFALVSPIPMGNQELIWPRRTGGVAANFVGEGSAITAADPTYENVSLRAKTLSALTIASEQIIADSPVGVADKVFEEIAHGIADRIDECFFIGDGSATYGGMVGIARKMGTAATNAARVHVGGTTTDAHTQAEISLAISKLPRSARSNLKITCTPQIASALFDRLSTSTTVGGLLRSEIVNGTFVRSWMGIPIIENNHMNNRTDASSGTNPTGFTVADDIDFIVGNFDQALLFGQRLDVELAMSRERYFDSYAVGLRGVARFDVNVYNASTTSGSLVAFWQT